MQNLAKPADLVAGNGGGESQGNRTGGLTDFSDQRSPSTKLATAFM
jgi:hypothetical protein